MKKILITLFFVLTGFIKNVNTRTTGVPDTLAYQQTIVANKSPYIGQPFSKLMDSLKIQIIFFSPFSSIPYNKSKETSTSFSFYFPQNADEIYLTYPNLRISWQPYLDANQSDVIRLNNNNRGRWNSEAATFYASGIIADVQIREL